ncbi:PilZ domain-containing protein [Azorhizophilus paspali]|uniref:PilZ domain-containing protein n=1 Tax=Azorhizophilus paspali TaxID=69963 RepID=UPI003630C459
MEQASDTYSRIKHLDKCRDLLEQLCEQGGARLIGLSPDTPSLAVVLMEVVPGERLVIDLTALPAVAPLLESGGYDSHLAGRVASTLLRSAPLGGWQRLSVPGRVQLACLWPEWLEILHRRSAFRAELPTRLTVPVEVLPARGMQPFAGRLLDLSQGGCRIELPAGSASELQVGQVVEQIILHFPNGQQIGLRGDLPSPAQPRLEGGPFWLHLRQAFRRSGAPAVVLRARDRTGKCPRCVRWRLRAGAFVVVPGRPGSAGRRSVA